MFEAVILQPLRTLRDVVFAPLNFDRWYEILSTLGRNKLRTALTALSVAWGIFMLVILMGFGNGLQNGFKNAFQDDAVNSIWIIAGRTSEPFEGHPVGRRLTWKNADFDEIKDIPGVDKITGRFFVRGGPFWGGDLPIRRGTKTTTFDVRSVHPDHLYLENTQMVAGRFINDTDLAEKRKVAVIGGPVAEFLFEGEPALGQWFEVNGVAFQVVGTFKDSGGEEEERKIYVPVSTAQTAFNGADRLGMIMFTVGDADEAEAKQIADAAVAELSKRHSFDPLDEQAARVRNNVEMFTRISTVFLIMRIFVWVVGFGTILAGIVGVSNIMMIAVKERTKEIGVRKALGATPWGIVGMIVQEAVVLTAFAGYLGMFVGVAILESLSLVIPANDYFNDPTIDFTVAIAATGLLVLSGALAGFFPARAAAKVNPIVALRDQ